MRLKLLKAALLVTLTASVAHAAPTAVMDLVCTGQAVDAAGASTPFETRISVDLEAKRWCDRKVGCPYVFPIRARDGDDVQLLAVKTPLNEAAFDVNLKTGAFTRSTRIPDRPDTPTSAKGVCTRAAFTPFG